MIGSATISYFKNHAVSYMNRNYSTNTKLGFHPRVNSVISQLNMIAPRFLLKDDEIDILTEPKDFYNQLKEKISSADERIFLSSLYIGKTQHELIDCLSQALEAKPNLKLHILIDYLRATREYPNPSSLTTVSTLLKKFGNHRVDIRLYHTPKLSGMSEKIVPKRFNEGFGLQHMKIYGFDDEVIISGANLSEDYFSNRQDRYYVFKNVNLTDYFFNLGKLISQLSHKVSYLPHRDKILIDWPTKNLTADPKLNLERFLVETTHLLEPILHGERVAHYDNDEYQKIIEKDLQIKEIENKKFAEDPEYNDRNTIVFPVSQLTPLLKPDISTEKPAILRLLSYLDSSTVSWTFTAGYFNMEPEIKRRLLTATSKSGEVITASPKANSFFKSSWPSKYIPPAYLYLCEQFLREVNGQEKENNIKVKEWEKGVVNTENGWSYHAKGIWISEPDETIPSITVIGSSNYTKRSYSLDLETNVVLITKDEKLKRKMQSEIDNINQHTRELSIKDFEDNKDPDRNISWGVKILAKIFANRL
ncbi:CDP-diacylglycerol--glycerol-3-phosphate 3-phosphatidyltransferase [Saccharomycopsis crataegensis]|uniref:CDP-diacylglycerol--glycerol-3-phosphate 3-phosphatidyltransferase n=1 Tax=Saccharomycopsis crataegensis TaxID=43959 RepID=A0AAV5QER5_9ASCO|nr:CDP-diacylglycerol--glycerol-3-phosphate 3-phosphatidyltransferase [Saccharomycopsis crataegensis]